MISSLQITMAEQVCFNCHKPGHLSVHCPEPQQKVRCPSCDKVNGHTPNCQNRDFNSHSRFQRTTVFSLQNLLKIVFQNVTEVFTAQDVSNNIEIGNVPLWLSTTDTFVAKTGPRSLSFATSRPMKRNITIVNKNNEPVLSLVFFQKMLTVNQRFELDDKGNISFNQSAVNGIEEKIVCKIGINNTADFFKIRISWHEHKHVFQVYPIIGPIVVDPQQPSYDQTPDLNRRAIENRK